MNLGILILVIAAIVILKSVRKTINIDPNALGNGTETAEDMENQADELEKKLKKPENGNKDDAGRPSHPQSRPFQPQADQNRKPYQQKERTRPQPAPKQARPTSPNRGAAVETKDLYGLIGKPLTHSYSMVRFKKKFREEKISADYLNFELDNASEIVDLVRDNPTIKGLNVTIPYKQDVMQYLDYIDPEAQQIGAVNVVKVIREEEGKVRLEGYNTDFIGFTESLLPLLPQDREGMKALVLGTGGASKAVKYALDKLNIDSRFVSRNSGFDNLGYYELSPSVFDDFRLIVNCTPVGMYPNVDQCPEIPYSYLEPTNILYDLVYNPEDTLFMQKGRNAGCTVCNGLKMLEIQAQKAWEIWNR